MLGIRFYRSAMCDLEKLKLLLNKQLNLDENLELFEHLDQCDSCRMTIYSLSRDRDKDFLIYRPYKIKSRKRKKQTAA